MIWPMPPSPAPAPETASRLTSSALSGSGTGHSVGASGQTSLTDDSRTANVTRSAPTMLDRIRASIPALPPAEQRVAKLVLADPRSFASMPVGELAERAHVSKPTVVRFCRSVGYDGLADFKLKLAGTVNEGVPFVHRAVDEDDKPGDIIVTATRRNEALSDVPIAVSAVTAETLQNTGANDIRQLNQVAPSLLAELSTEEA